MKSEIINDIVKWDIASWEKALLFWEKKIDKKDHLKCLELGGHEGGLSLWLALQGHEVICSDIENVKIHSEPLHKKHNVSDKIKYQNIDATNIPYENHFDIVIFKSIVGGIGRGNNILIQQKVFEQINKALKPGGKLLFAENLKASILHQFLRKKFIKWGSSWRYPTIQEMHLFLKNFKSYEIKTTGVIATFGKKESQKRMLSYIDKFILNNISMESWKYICYGIAEK